VVTADFFTPVIDDAYVRPGRRRQRPLRRVRGRQGVRPPPRPPATPGTRRSHRWH
jgi:hypothetical protein